MKKMFKVSFDIPDMGVYSKCIEINNVPRDLPEQFENTLKYAAISTLNGMINRNIFNHYFFINVYNINDNCASLINIKKINTLNILDIKAV